MSTYSQVAILYVVLLSAQVSLPLPLNLLFRFSDHGNSNNIPVSFLYLLVPQLSLELVILFLVFPYILGKKPRSIKLTPIEWKHPTSHVCCLILLFSRE